MKPSNVLRNLLLSASLAGAVFAAPAYAQISFNINVAPPAPQLEVVPNVSPGYVWAPGYWGWSGERHVWVRGRSIPQRDGYRWTPDRWDQRSDGYYRTVGHWEHDSSYKAVKVKKEKKHKNWNQDNGRRGKGKGKKHDD